MQKDKFDEFEQGLDALFEENSELQKENERLKSTIASLKTKLKSAEAELNEVKQENEALSNTVEKYMQRMHKLFGQKKAGPSYEEPRKEEYPALHNDIPEEKRPAEQDNPYKLNNDVPTYEREQGFDDDDDIEEGVVEVEEDEPEIPQMTPVTRPSKQEQPKVEVEEDEFEETEPEIEEEPETPAPKPQETNVHPTQKKPIIEPPQNANQEYGYFPYKEDIYAMSKNEFTFTYSQLNFLDESDEIIDITELIVTPLNTKEKNPPLLVWMAFSDNTTQTLTTEAGKIKNPIPCGRFTIILTGTMRGNTFVTHIALKPNQVYRGVQLKVVTKQNGNNGHLYIKHEDTRIHIAPVNFENNDSGYADFTYCFVKDGKVVRCGDNIDDGVFLTDKFNIKQEVMVKWSDGTLYGVIVPATVPTT